MAVRPLSSCQESSFIFFRSLPQLAVFTTNKEPIIEEEKRSTVSFEGKKKRSSRSSLIISQTRSFRQRQEMGERQYLVHFVNRHIDFRYAELDAVMEMLGVDPAKAYER